jgi:hypothetical protein
MADFSIRSDQVDVEQIMRQIRARIKEKRGVDYTEEEIRELANVKLERFLDPRALRSDLLAEYRRQASMPGSSPPPTYVFGDETLYETHRAPLRWIRRLLNPVLKLFFNPNKIIHVLHLQEGINDYQVRQRQRDDLNFELLHNLVLEITRLGMEVKNLKMRVESLSTRLDFDERRARALEGVVQYRPGAADAPLPQGGDEGETGDAAEGDSVGRPGKRRRRRRGRRRLPGEGGAPPGGSEATSGDEGPAGPEERADTAPAVSNVEPGGAPPRPAGDIDQ